MPTSRDSNEEALSGGRVKGGGEIVIPSCPKLAYLLVGDIDKTGFHNCDINTLTNGEGQDMIGQGYAPATDPICKARMSGPGRRPRAPLAHRAEPCRGGRRP